MLRIKDPKTLPNGGFPFKEHGRTFNPMVSFAFQVSEILTFRKDNDLPRATPQEAAEDLNNFMCNQHPELCFDSTVRVSAPSYRNTTGCPSCGGRAA